VVEGLDIRTKILKHQIPYRQFINTKISQ